MDKKITIPTVDVIIVNEDSSKIVLVKRGKEPFKGNWCFPGGHLEYNEEIEKAAEREVKEETNLDILILDIMGVYSDPRRDPSKHSISTVFVAKPITENIHGGDDTAEAEWFDISEIDTEELAFDHGKILEDFKIWKEAGGTFWSTKQ